MPTPALSIANELGRVLTEKHLQLATAESCTGGQIATTLCAADNASAFYGCGFVTCTDQAKIRLLAVNSETITACTAVSEQVVTEMATGAMQHSGADVSLAVNGYAGPEGGSDGAPVGTVWFAWAVSDDEMHTRVKQFEGDSEAIIKQATNYALGALIKLLAEKS